MQWDVLYYNKTWINTAQNTKETWGNLKSTLICEFQDYFSDKDMHTSLFPHLYKNKPFSHESYTATAWKTKNPGEKPYTSHFPAHLHPSKYDG